MDAGPVHKRIPISEAQRQAVYEVSPTARRLAPALEDPDNQWRFSGCETVPDCDYAGGWMTWAIRDAAAEAGAFGSAQQSSDFFRRLAEEISRACADDRLTCRTKLPSAMQPLQRITVPQFLDSFERLTGSVLSSKEQYLHIDVLATETPEQRAEFLAVSPELPSSAAQIARQSADYEAHSWQYRLLGLTYTVVFPVGAALGFVLLVVLLVSRRGRRAVGPLAALALALLFAAVLRIALIAAVDAADYDADQPRYLYPAHVLLLAFGAVALVEGLSRLDLRRLGVLVGRDDDEDPAGPVLPEVPAGPVRPRHEESAALVGPRSSRGAGASPGAGVRGPRTPVP